jgi:hypothetical protein
MYKDLRINYKHVQTAPYKYLYSQHELFLSKPIVGAFASGVLGFWTAVGVLLSKRQQLGYIRRWILPSGLLNTFLSSAIIASLFAIGYLVIFADRQGYARHRLAKDEIRKVMMLRPDHFPYLPRWTVPFAGGAK